MYRQRQAIRCLFGHFVFILGSFPACTLLPISVQLRTNVVLCFLFAVLDRETILLHVRSVFVMWNWYEYVVLK